MIRRCAARGCPCLVRWTATCPAHRTSTDPGSDLDVNAAGVVEPWTGIGSPRRDPCQVLAATRLPSRHRLYADAVREAAS